MFLKARLPSPQAARDSHELRLFFSNYLVGYSIHTHPVRYACHESMGEIMRPKLAWKLVR
jgi:hypothetical protein